MFADVERAQARQLRGALEFGHREFRVLHRQHDGADEAVRIFEVGGRAGVIGGLRQFQCKGRRRPVDHRVGHRQRIHVDLARVHFLDHQIEIDHVPPHHRGLGAAVDRQHHGITLGVLAHFRAVGGAFLFHQGDKFLRIPVGMRVDHTQLAVVAVAAWGGDVGAAGECRGAAGGEKFTTMHAHGALLSIRQMVIERAAAGAPGCRTESFRIRAR